MMNTEMNNGGLPDNTSQDRNSDLIIIREPKKSTLSKIASRCVDMGSRVTSELFDADKGRTTAANDTKLPCAVGIGEASIVGTTSTSHVSRRARASMPARRPHRDNRPITTRGWNQVLEAGEGRDERGCREEVGFTRHEYIYGCCASWRALRPHTSDVEQRHCRNSATATHIHLKSPYAPRRSDGDNLRQPYPSSSGGSEIPRCQIPGNYEAAIHRRENRQVTENKCDTVFRNHFGSSNGLSGICLARWVCGLRFSVEDRAYFRWVGQATPFPLRSATAITLSRSTTMVSPIVPWLVWHSCRRRLFRLFCGGVYRRWVCDSWVQ